MPLPSHTISLSYDTHIFQTSQDPNNTPQPRETFLPESPCTSPLKSYIPPPGMRYLRSPTPAARYSTSIMGIEELSDSQWAATQAGGMWSSQTDVYGLEDEARRIIEVEERRSEKRTREDPRRNDIAALRAKRSRKSSSTIQSPPPSSQPGSGIQPSGSRSGSSSAPIDLSDSPPPRTSSAPVSWSASPQDRRLERDAPFEDAPPSDNESNHEEDTYPIPENDENDASQDAWEVSRPKKTYRRTIVDTEEDDEGDDTEEVPPRPSLRKDKGKGKCFSTKTPTLGDLFQDDEDADPKFEPYVPHQPEDEEDEYDGIFDNLDFEYDDPPPLPSPRKSPRKTNRTPLKALSAYPVPSSASTSHLLTPGRTYTEDPDEEPLLLIPDLPEDVQGFYLNHWRRGADKSRAGETDYEDDLRAKRDEAKRKAASRFNRGGFRGRVRGRGRGKGRARASRK